MSGRGDTSVSTNTANVDGSTRTASGACSDNLGLHEPQGGETGLSSSDEARLAPLDGRGLCKSFGLAACACLGDATTTTTTDEADVIKASHPALAAITAGHGNAASQANLQTCRVNASAPGVAPQLLRRVASTLEVCSNDSDVYTAGCCAPSVDGSMCGGCLKVEPPPNALCQPGSSNQGEALVSVLDSKQDIGSLRPPKAQNAGGLEADALQALADLSSLQIASCVEGPLPLLKNPPAQPAQTAGSGAFRTDSSSGLKPAIRVRRNTKELIRKRSRSSDTADSTPRPLAVDTQEDSDGGSSSTGTSPTSLSPEAAPPPKQAPRRQSLLSSAIRRAASVAAFSTLRDNDAVDVDVAQALRDGIVRDEDVNLYGLRTQWQGLRHMEKHSESSPADAPAVLELRTSSRKDSGSRPKPRPLRRIETCPKSLTDHPELVKPQFRKKNIRPFHEVYKLGRVVGTGGFAVVRQCTHKVTGEEFAVKLLTVVPDGVEEAEREVTYRMMVDELQMMMELSHDNIVHLKEFFFDEGVCCIVMQLLEGEDLMDHLHEDGHSQADVKIVMQRLLDAISHMHDHGISHRDLKLENLVLAKPGDLTTVTIVDFGLAKAARARQEMKGVVGTTHYCAPEILLGRPYTPVVDSWSLGVVMYLMLTGEYPFNHEDEDELEDLIIDTEPSYDSALWAGISPEAMDLVKGLLEKNPVHRLSPQEALEHAWFTGHEFHDSHTLKHVHKRMEYIRANKNLPVRQYKRGEWIVRKGERCARQHEAYLIVTGEAEVLLWQPENALAGPDGFLQLGLRRPGNFVGAMSVHYDEHAESPASQRAPSPHALQRASSSGSGHLASSWSSQRAWSQAPWGTNAASSFARSASDSLGSSDAPRSADSAGHALRVVFMLLRVMHRWVGRRRVISVRALTDVSVLVLSHDDMVWAVAHDYRLCSELSDALKKRRLVIKSQETVVRGKGKAKVDAAPKSALAFFS